MRILFLADLHGNMVATEAMEKMIRFLAPDDIWFLGDAVGKGPQSRETCDWVRANCRHFIGGNWDYGIGGREFSEDGYFWDQLGEERMAWLNSLPLEDELTVCGQRFRLFHGRPVTPLLVATTESTELEPLFETEKGRFQGVLFADSHRPFVRTLNCGYYMNTGSVGNSMGVPRAHALLMESVETLSALSFQVISVPYDNEKAAQIARSDPHLPHKDAYIREVLTRIYSRD